MNWWTFIVASLAVWRLSVLVTEEEGPFSAFMLLRSKVDYYQHTWVGRGLNCFWCVSFWFGLAEAGVWAYITGASVVAAIGTGLALSTAAILLHRVMLCITCSQTSGR